MLTFPKTFWLYWFIDDQVSYFLNVLTKCGLWNSNLIKKSKFDFSVYSWLFHQLTKFHLSIQWSWEMFWAMKLGKNVGFESLRLYVKPLDHVLGQIILDQSDTVKTLFLTILPFWWFEQFCWGIVIQTLSIDTYDFKILILVENIEVWL